MIHNLKSEMYNGKSVFSTHYSPDNEVNIKISGRC